MKRWLTRILICLALGAVTTVGVAWAFVVISNQWRVHAIIRALNVLPDRSRWSVEQRGPRSVVVTHEKWDAEVPRSETSEGSYFAARATYSADGLSEVLQVGWPLLAMKNTGECEQMTGLRDAALIACLRIPLWPGFLIDTLFYGALWLGLIVGPGAARRGLRKKRGRCPRCGYDLRGGLPQAGRLCHPIQGCPECGWNRQSTDVP